MSKFEPPKLFSKKSKEPIMTSFFRSRSWSQKKFCGLGRVGLDCNPDHCTVCDKRNRSLVMSKEFLSWADKLWGLHWPTFSSSFYILDFPACHTPEDAERRKRQATGLNVDQTQNLRTYFSDCLQRSVCRTCTFLK